MKSLMGRSVSVSQAHIAYQFNTILQNEQSHVQMFPIVQCGSFGRSEYLYVLGFGSSKTRILLSLTQIPHSLLSEKPDCHVYILSRLWHVPAELQCAKCCHEFCPLGDSKLDFPCTCVWRRSHGKGKGWLQLY